jgi:uroporphyrinogen-III decarboxylase
MTAAGPSPKARAKALLRPAVGLGRQPALFLPLVHALAANIEALKIQEFLLNPSKLAKGLHALYQALGTDGITCACGAGLEIEALGFDMDWNVYPPRVVAASRALDSLDADRIAELIARAPRIGAGAEATRRLAAACPGDPALVVGLTGPACLAAQIALAIDVDPATAPASNPALLETAGRAVLESARQFLLAGANVIILLEGNLPASDALASDTWREMVTPIANLTRFHKAVPIMAGPVDLGRLPPSMLPCVSAEAPAGGLDSRPHALALGANSAVWRLTDPAAAVVTTDGELPMETDIGALRAACQRVRGEIDHAAGGTPTLGW